MLYEVITAMGEVGGPQQRHVGQRLAGGDLEHEHQQLGYARTGPDDLVDAVEVDRSEGNAGADRQVA